MITSEPLSQVTNYLNSKSDPRHFYQILPFLLSDTTMERLRKELSVVIDKVEDHFRNHGNRSDFSDFHESEPHRLGEILYCLGVNNPHKPHFEYAASGVALDAVDYGDYWIVYFRYKDRKLANRDFRTFVPKIAHTDFSEIRALAQKCSEHLGIVVGSGPFTANIFRTPPHCKWYCHKDVMNPKLVIPIYSNNQSRFRWYGDEFSRADDFLCEMPIKLGQIHAVNTHEWHTTENYGDTEIRWNLTFEGAYPG